MPASNRPSRRRCDAALVAGRTEFAAGGRLVAELQYDLKARPAAVADFSVSEIEASYVLSDAQEANQ